MVFPFVEAGLGHIMPMTAVCDAFEEKYGDRCEIVRTKFFQDKQDPDLKYVEDTLIKEVKNHNKYKIFGLFQFSMMRLVGQKISLKFLYGTWWKRGFKPSLALMQELNADLIFNTHFATLYYACAAKKRGLIDSKIVVYCPDPIIGQQWDRRADVFALSSAAGKVAAEKKRGFKNTSVVQVPFLIRKAVASYTESRAFYRREIDVPEDKFTILLADGAYGAGRLGETVRQLLKSKLPLNVIAVCGKNEKLYEEFQKLTPPGNITFKPYGFTDKMLTLSAACDLFIGKAGASNLAEPAYFGAPAIITFTATPIEKWIGAHYTDFVKSAIKITNVKKAVQLAERWAQSPELMAPYVAACASERRCDGPDILADKLWEILVSDK
ncbi:MAG: hypothetical protein FWD58_00900 [Firmicutes bacterium]|nr:hypothetical protein [Bacillota bacterium]